MFDYNSMIKRAITFFPKWTDIRKRYTKSVGGQFVGSILHEEAYIKDALDEYIKSYFLISYTGKEDEVMTFAYKAHVGDLTSFSDVYVYYKENWFPFATTAKDFENITTYSYYEDGYIYIREEDYDKDTPRIELRIGESSSLYKLERTHIWNIFDEFATFMSLRRQEWETNSELVKRILYTATNLPSSSEEGLKHAIIAELLTDCPDIKMEHIKIEPVTPKNLIKPYEDYETLLDMLAEVNRDIYRCKKWDADFWTYDFESISYIPHVWDKAITEWKNGIGSGDDLKVILADNVDTTDATIYFYKKSLESFQVYLRDKYIETDIDFSMTKYHSALNKTNVKYRITASELKEITNDDIKLQIYEAKDNRIDVSIDEVAADWGKDIIKRDNNVISSSDNDTYKIEFTNKNNEDLKIITAEVYYTDSISGEELEVLDLKVPGNGFIINAENELVAFNNNRKLSAIEHFNSSYGLTNSLDGIVIDTDAVDGNASVSIEIDDETYLDYSFECNSVGINKSLIDYVGGYWNDNNEYVVRGDFSTENKVVSFDIDANYVSFYIEPTEVASINKIRIIDKTDSKTYSIELGGGEWFHSSQASFVQESMRMTRSGEEEFVVENNKFNEPNVPHSLTIEIDVLSLEDVKFSNFSYKNYEIDFTLSNGILVATDTPCRYKIESVFNNIDLNLYMKTAQGDSPILKGVWIGDNFDSNYLSVPIPYKTNCQRTFNIRTNAAMKLLKEENGEFKVLNENYYPVTEYEATSDSAYIDLDLSQYENISSITTTVGHVETIVESDSVFYKLKLSHGQKLSVISLYGQFTNNTREITLSELIQSAVPDFNNTYDKVYCSSLSKGLILSRMNPGGTSYTEIINIASTAVEGINAFKYVMKTPGDVGVIYGTTGGVETKNNTSYNSFDYISFYPAGSQVYEAINEFVTVVETNRKIPIVDNFAPTLNTNKYLFYKVELFDKSQENIIVKFHNEDTENSDIDDLLDWSIGTSNTLIAIDNKAIDVHNKSSYTSQAFDVSISEVLSTSVDIKDAYTLTNSTILNTEHFIIEPKDERVSVVYQNYNGSKETEHLLKYEELLIDGSGFNKLVCSNVDTIYHLSTIPYTTHYIREIEGTNIINDAGILVWNQPISSDKVYIVYSIKKPVGFQFDTEFLYEKAEYDILAYSELGHIYREGFKDKEKLNIKNEVNSLYESGTLDFDFDEVELIYTSCSEPTFESILQGEDTIMFSKYIEEDTILIKTGYYYMNGREYYLFSNNGDQTLSNNKYYSLTNVDYSAGELITYKETNNYLYNSEMRLKNVAELYNYNTTLPLSQGISTLNTLTACESFNDWTCFGMGMELTKGLNDFGIKFASEVYNGYAFIDLTNYLEDGPNYFSFYATPGLETYIGREENYLGINFNRSINIKLKEQVVSENSSEDIRNTIITKTDEMIHYYLVVKGSGILDDLILSTDINNSNMHVKNIDLLGLEFDDKRTEGDRIKLRLKDNKDYKAHKAGLMSDGYIKNTSAVDWYITKIFELDKDDDFMKCHLTHIGVNADYAYTDDRQGLIETPLINLGDPKTIKNLIVKINDIEFSNMQGFICDILTSNTQSGPFENKQIIYSNSGHVTGDKLSRYVKLKISLPANKVINNVTVFAEYKSTEENLLPIKTSQSGYIESKIYDLQEVVDVKVKKLNINDVENLNDVMIYIRTSRDVDRVDVWNDWKLIPFDNNYKITSNIILKGARFVQYKVVLKSRQAYIKFNNIELEVM